jgi:hypothetical protein
MEEVVGSIPTRSTNSSHTYAGPIPFQGLPFLRLGSPQPHGHKSLVWYIVAMMLKGSAIFAVLLAMAQPPAAAIGQATNNSGANGQASPLSTPANQPSVNWHTPPLSLPSAAPQDTGSPAAIPDCNGVPCEYPTPHITIANPAPVPATDPWPYHERIAWIANLVLAFVGYAGVILAVSTLKKIERQIRATETVAEAAANSADAALQTAQAIIESGRPWLLIAVKPSRSAENSFTITAANRGRSPARVFATFEQIRIAADEAQLPQPPEYTNEKPGEPFVPVILLPGESMAIKPFSRDDLRGICETEEIFKKVEAWEEKVFIYGKILYEDLISQASRQVHESAWCYWYIHGRENSGMVIAGPPEYNLHT